MRAPHPLPHPATTAPAGAVLITGASTGIGAAAAVALAERGYFVFAGVRSAAAGEAVVAAAGGAARAAALPLDVTDPASIAAATLAIAAALESGGSGVAGWSSGSDEGGQGGGAGAGAASPSSPCPRPPPPPRRLAALVNNAGVSFPGPLLAQPAADLDATLAVNLTGALAVTRAVGPLLGIADAVGVPGLGPAWRREAGQAGQAGKAGKAAVASKTGAPAPPPPPPPLAPPSHGRGRPVILNISSVAGKVAGPYMGAYAASKHGLEGASDALRREVAPFGVEVVVLELGAVATPIWAKADALDLAPYAQTAWGASLATFMRLMGREGRAGCPAPAAGAVIADVIAKAGRAPVGSGGGGGWFWALTTRPPPRVELIPNKFAVWTAPRLLPDRVTDWAVAALFGLGG